MKKKQSIRLALDALEKEMSVLSNAEILSVLGGNGGPGPLANGYCTFNNMAFIAQQMGVNVTAGNVLANYVADYGISDFTFATNNTVTGVQAGSSSNANQMLNSMFNVTNLSSGEGIRQQIENGNLVSISSAAGHAYTITSYSEDDEIFIFRDTTTGQNIEVQNNTHNMAQFTNAQAITGVKFDPTDASGGWINSSLDYVVDPMSTGAFPSTGSNSTSTGY